MTKSTNPPALINCIQNIPVSGDYPHLKNVILPKAVSPRRAPGPNGDAGTV